MSNAVRRTDREWKEILDTERYRVLREKGTERPFSGKYTDHHEPGVYVCGGCGAELFVSESKFDAHCGWPSFSAPAAAGRIEESADNTLGMRRVEVTCARCGGHLGHVFDDGPKPTGLRYCINSVALDFRPPVKTAVADVPLETVFLGAGCFWCTEAVFQSIPGVKAVRVGYMGGTVKNPTYKEVCRGDTGHAEVAEVVYDPAKVDLDAILDVFWKAHDPTTLNRQGADVGTQYRSVIYVTSETQKQTAETSRGKLQGKIDGRIVTQIAPSVEFYQAEDYHQDYYRTHPDEPYCRMVIAPKLKKIRP